MTSQAAKNVEIAAETSPLPDPKSEATALSSNDQPESRQGHGATPIALIDLGSAKIGIDVADLREVMPAPETLLPFQSSAPGVVGCVALRGQVVPVVDLMPLLGLPRLDPDIRGGVVVIVGDSQQVYGIVAKAALQLVQAKDCVPQMISRDDGALIDRLLPQVVLFNQEALGILDAAVLPGLGVPQSRSDRVRNEARDPSRSYLIFETDGVRFGLLLSHIQATLPEVSVNPSVLRSGLSEGSVIHNGIERPLISLTRRLGMSKLSSAPSRAAVVLFSRGDQPPLAFRADRVSDILSLSHEQIQPMPSLLSTHPEMFIGVRSESGEPVLFFLDGQALMGDETLSAYGGLENNFSREENTKTQSTHDSRILEREAVLALLVEAGARCSLDVDVVEEIVSLQGKIAESYAAGSCYLGTITSRRGALIPAFSLAGALGHEAKQTPGLSALVVVRRNGEQVGLAVDNICAFEKLFVMPDQSDSGTRILQRNKSHDSSLWAVVDADSLDLRIR